MYHFLALFDSFWHILSMFPCISEIGDMKKIPKIKLFRAPISFFVSAQLFCTWCSSFWHFLMPFGTFYPSFQVALKLGPWPKMPKFKLFVAPITCFIKCLAKMSIFYNLLFFGRVRARLPACKKDVVHFWQGFWAKMVPDHKSKVEDFQKLG